MQNVAKQTKQSKAPKSNGKAQPITASAPGVDHVATMDATAQHIIELWAEGRREDAIKAYQVRMTAEAQLDHATEAVNQMVARDAEQRSPLAAREREANEHHQHAIQELTIVRESLTDLYEATMVCDSDYANACQALAHIESIVEYLHGLALDGVVEAREGQA